MKLNVWFEDYILNFNGVEAMVRDLLRLTPMLLTLLLGK